jgi:prophage maintenance system killer protein
MVTAAFYELNGYDLRVAEQREIDRFVRSVAAGDIDRAEVAAWLRAHTNVE